MFTSILIIVWGLVSFWAGFFLYKKGLVDGINFSQKKEIQPEKNPVKFVYDGVSNVRDDMSVQKENEAYMAGLRDIAYYQVPGKEGGR